MPTLYIVSTPIGNLKDITLRALEILKEVDFIVCEDTRVTSNLLKEYEIKKELVSLNAYNEQNKIKWLVNKLKDVKQAALVSDAGTPGISDPGARFIRLAIDENIDVEAVPGPSALLAALVVAGFPTDSFIFDGFLPQKKGRKKLLEFYNESERTVVVYESVHRIAKLIGELNEIMPERYIAICRELTKKFQEVIRDKVKNIYKEISNLTLKGEFVVIISPKGWKQNER